MISAFQESFGGEGCYFFIDIFFTNLIYFRDISSNSASETEELIERQEKVIDQLDKKRKVTIFFIL